MVWIQIRTEILSVLIWVQTIHKGYQQMTKVAASKERVNKVPHILVIYQTYRKTVNSFTLEIPSISTNCRHATVLTFISPNYLLLAFFKHSELIKLYELNTCLGYRFDSVNITEANQSVFPFYVLDNVISECIFPM